MSLDNLDGQITPGDLLDLGIVTRDANGRLQQNGGSNPLLDVSNVRAPLRRFHVALGKREGAACDILAVGDSITEGVGPSLVTNRWLDRFRDQIRSRYSVSGVTGGYGYVPTSYGQSNLSGGFVSLTGSPAQSNFGLGRRSQTLTDATKSITITITCTAIDIFWTKTTGNSAFTYTVDGGSATTVQTGGGSVVSSANRTQITGLTAGSHTIIVTGTATGTSFIEGFMVYNGDESKGVRIWDGAHSSYTTDSFIAAANQQWLPVVGIVQPALILIELGVNDAFTGVSVATYTANMQALIAALRAQCTIAPSIVLVTPWPRGDFTNDTVWPPYYAAMQTLVQSDGSLAFFDMASRTYTTTSAALADQYSLLTTGKVHPNDQASLLWADALADYLAP